MKKSYFNTLKQAIPAGYSVRFEDYLSNPPEFSIANRPLLIE